MKTKKWIVLLLTMFVLIKPIQALASEENVIVRLDLSKYDSFSEKIEVICESASGAVRGELNLFNHYEYKLFLEPDVEYMVSLMVIGDELNLIDLAPMQFPVVPSTDVVQTYTIAVRDSAGLAAENGGHEGMTYEEESAEIPLEAETYIDESSDSSIGTLTVTGADVAGVKSFTYSLQDQEGNTKTYVLKKENDFKAVIYLPYGKYQELLENVTVEPEEGITIPEDAAFYCKYYGNKYSQRIVIDSRRQESENLSKMQLWVKREGGAEYRMDNLYQFAGNAVMKTDDKADITGHVETSDINEKIPRETVENLNTQEKNQEHPLKLWPFVFLVFAVGIGATGFIVWRKKSERQ